MKTFETERIVLREWQLADIDDLYEYAKTPKVGPMAGWKPHDNIGETKEILDMFIRQDETWAICVKETGKVIGSVGLHGDSKRSLDKSEARMLGYVLSEDYWGQGIMQEVCREVIRFAFEDLGIGILSVFHYPFNHQSKRVIEKLGFSYEGILRQGSTIYDGTVLDEVCYSMTKDEYLEKR